MSTARDDDKRCRITVVDDDPLRARREARELLAEIADTDPDATLSIPRQQPAGADSKGGLSAQLVGLLISGGSLVAASVQVWLARVPQRTIIVSRSDGATLRISGRQARADDERIERFLRGDTAEAATEGPADTVPPEDGGSAS